MDNIDWLSLGLFCGNLFTLIMIFFIGPAIDRFFDNWKK